MNGLSEYVFSQFGEDNGYFKIESPNNIDSEIILLILNDKKSKIKRVNETTKFVSIDDSFSGHGFSLSLFNCPLISDYDKLKVLCNDLNKKNKSTNVSYYVDSLIGFVFIITASFFSYSDISHEYSMLTYADESGGGFDNEDSRRKSEIERLMQSVLVDMKLAVLHTSIEIDGIINKW